MPTIWRLLVLAGTLSIPALAAAQPRGVDRVFVRGYAGATFSSANGSDHVDGALVGGGVGFGLSPHLSLIGDVGYISNLASENGEDALRRIAALITLVSGPDAEIGVEARTLTFMGGARYTFWAPDVGLRPFIEGEGGLARSDFRLKLGSGGSTLANDANTIFKGLIGDIKTTAPAAGAGAGFDIQLSNSLWAEVAYHYLRLFGDAKSNVHQVSGGVKFTF